MKKTLLLCALAQLLGVPPLTIAAQSDFREGFIINLLQDTVRGLVDYRSNAQNYKSCRFKLGQDIVEYTPDQLSGFGYEHDKVFRASVTEDTFVEVLVDGALSLYKSSDHYLLQRPDGEIFRFRQEALKEGGSSSATNRWIGVFNVLLQDCANSWIKKREKLRLNEQVITQLTIQYHECRNEQYTVYKSGKPWTRLEWGVALGARSSSYTFNPLVLNTADYPYFDEAFNSIDPSVGIVLAISSPRLSENFAFQPEVHFTRSEFMSDITLPAAHTDNRYFTRIRLNTLSIPLSIRYNLPERKISGFAQLGAILEYQLQAESQVLFERYVGEQVVGSQETSFPIRKNQVGLTAGLGVIKPFKSYSGSLAVRYAQLTTPNQVTGIVHNSRQLGLYLILLKR